jgi:hypothetical protein
VLKNDTNDIYVAPYYLLYYQIKAMEFGLSYHSVIVKRNRMLNAIQLSGAYCTFIILNSVSMKVFKNLIFSPNHCYLQVSLEVSTKKLSPW